MLELVPMIARASSVEGNLPSPVARLSYAWTVSPGFTRLIRSTEAKKSLISSRCLHGHPAPHSGSGLGLPFHFWRGASPAGCGDEAAIDDIAQHHSREAGGEGHIKKESNVNDTFCVSSCHCCLSS